MLFRDGGTLVKAGLSASETYSNGAPFIMRLSGTTCQLPTKPACLNNLRMRGDHIRRRSAVTGNQTSRFSPLASRQNSQATHRPGKLSRWNPHIQPAGAGSETSNRQKETINSPTSSCQGFCVMDAPEIYHSPGLGVVSEFLTAI